MPEHTESLAERLAAARAGLEVLLAARAGHAHPPGEANTASSAPAAGFRHWGDTPQWYDWHKR